MVGVNWFVLLMSLLQAAIIIAAAAWVLYWTARAAVKAELKSYFASAPHAEHKEPASDSQVDNSGS